MYNLETEVSSQKNCSYVHKFLVAGLFHDFGKENYMFKFVKWELEANKKTTVYIYVWDKYFGQ